MSVWRIYNPGEERHGYVFEPAVYEINNMPKEVLTYTDTHYSPYINDQVYSVSYGFAFIENGKLKALKKGTIKLTAKIKNVKLTIKIKIVK